MNPITTSIRKSKAPGQDDANNTIATIMAKVANNVG